MKPTGNPNLNTKTYWDAIYGDEQKRAEYAAEGTATPPTGKTFCKPTMRFTEAVKYVADGDCFLDIGCGVGQLTELVFKERKNSDVWGTDISGVVIAENSKKNPQIHYVQQYVGDQQAIPSNYFDVVFSGEVLEHLDQPKKLFEDASRVLRTGGKFICTTPNAETIHSDEHVWFFTPDDIEQLYFSHGFKQVEFIYLPKLEHLYVIMAVGVKI